MQALAHLTWLHTARVMTNSPLLFQTDSVTQEPVSMHMARAGDMTTASAVEQLAVCLVSVLANALCQVETIQLPSSARLALHLGDLRWQICSCYLSLLLYWVSLLRYCVTGQEPLQLQLSLWQALLALNKLCNS